MAQKRQINTYDPNTGAQPIADPAAAPEPVVEPNPYPTDRRDVGTKGLQSPEEAKTLKGGTAGTSHPNQRWQMGNDHDNDTIASIRADIARTRAETARTIDAIQYRLSPGTIKAQARDKAKSMAHSATDIAKDTGGYMFDTIKENIVPTVLITSGLAWLVKSNSESQSHGGRAPSGYPPHIYPDYDEWGYAPDDQFRAVNRGYYSDSEDDEGEWKRRARAKAEEAKRRARETGGRVSGAAAQARERTAEVAEGVKERMGEMGHGVRRRTADMREQGRYRYRRARRGFFDTLYENPLALAGAALAVGTLFGAIIPESEQEREWMGDTRDDLMREARERGEDTLEKAQQVAQHAAESAKEGAKEEAERQNLTS